MMQRLVAGACVGTLLVGVGIFAAALPAHADTLTVSSTVDGSTGSLRDLVNRANITAGPDVINIPAGMEITLGQGPLLIGEDLVLRGAEDRPRIALATGANTTLPLLRAATGAALTVESINFGGPAVQYNALGTDAHAGELIVRDVEFHNFVQALNLRDMSRDVLVERATFGPGMTGIAAGGVEPGAGFTVRDSTFTGLSNHAIQIAGFAASVGKNITLGGNSFSAIGDGEGLDAAVYLGFVNAIQDAGVPLLNITGSVVRESNFSELSGAVFRVGSMVGYTAGREPSIRISGSTIERSNGVRLIHADANSSGDDRILIENSTVTGPAEARLLDVFQQQDTRSYLTRVQLIHNTLSGTLQTPHGGVIRAEIDSTVINSANAPLFDVSGLHIASNVVVTDPGTGLEGVRVIAPEDLGLLPLAAGPNGLPVRPLAADSPLLDTGSTRSALTVDERGKPRVSGPRSDVGAVEMQYSVLSIFGPGDVPTGQNARFEIRVIQAGELPIRVLAQTADYTALVDRDYVRSAGSLNWASATAGSQYLTVPTLIRAGNNHTEFLAQLSALSGALIEEGTAVARILAPDVVDASPSVSPSPTATIVIGSPSPTVTGGPGPSPSATGGTSSSPSSSPRDLPGTGAPSAVASAGIPGPIGTSSGPGSAATLGETGLPGNALGVSALLATLLLLAGSGLLLRRRIG
ncbi:right-handed parallel beta-helix repeat-containing protein [Mycetocola spongiae]|uniref:right-handed parallel beta-helix repeat-containing protein n=1 Tax=Mycetocola spongiae TaxID=2859226 RepID=UPI001CF40E39|nr:right-handed parallel beta-helix repeat-containing protein [Mycetocola spongiae]UCR89135.1 right-handed parallel beta-helix repeat-containing protein [Mycetocola spongiae]